jgi:hypothetical protein
MGSTVERAFHSARKRCRASQGVVHRLRQGSVILYLASWWVYHSSRGSGSHQNKLTWYTSDLLAGLDDGVHGLVHLT